MLSQLLKASCRQFGHRPYQTCVGASLAGINCPPVHSLCNNLACVFRAWAPTAVGQSEWVCGNGTYTGSDSRSSLRTPSSALLAMWPARTYSSSSTSASVAAASARLFSRSLVFVPFLGSVRLVWSRRRTAIVAHRDGANCARREELVQLLRRHRWSVDLGCLPLEEDAVPADSADCRAGKAKLSESEAPAPAASQRPSPERTRSLRR